MTKKPVTLKVLPVSLTIPSDGKPRALVTLIYDGGKEWFIGSVSYYFTYSKGAYTFYPLQNLTYKNDSKRDRSVTGFMIELERGDLVLSGVGKVDLVVLANQEMETSWTAGGIGKWDGVYR